MIPRDPDWLERVLGAEELAPEGRAALEDFFVAHPEARRLADRIHRLESNGAPRGEIVLPAGNGEPAWRATRERDEARESLRLLILRLGLELPAASAPLPSARPQPTGRSSSGWRRWIPAPLLVPAAVGALAILFWRAAPDRAITPENSVPPNEPSMPTPSPENRPDGRDPAERTSGSGPASAPEKSSPPAGPFLDDAAPFGSLSIERRHGMRGGPDANTNPDPTVGAIETWRTGDAFYLRFDAAQDGALVVLHVDPRGIVALLEPADPLQSPRIVRAGERIELPREDSSEEWTFDGEGGLETFLVATGDPASWSAREAISAALLPAPTRESPQETVLRVRRALEHGGAAVHELRVDHLPAETSAP